jgi:peptidyl-prolyl cis-trans isomerase SurA
MQPMTMQPAKITIAVAAFLAAMLGGGLPSRAQQGEIIDGVAAIVNHHIITISDVREYSRSAESSAVAAYGRNPVELQKVLNAIHRDALNTLVDRALILDEFDRKGGIVPEYVIDSRVRDLITSRFGGDRIAFRRSLRAEGLTEETHRKKIREQLIIENYSFRQISAEIFVSPYKMDLYYEANKDRFKVEDQIHLRMILVRKQGDEPAAVAARREMAQEIISKLETGRPFAEMAKAYSEQPQASTGGDWGWINRKSISDEFAAIAFKLNAGENSGIIETKDGFYILFVEEVKKAHTLQLADAREQIERVLEQEERTRIQRQLVEKLRRKAFIRIYPPFSDSQS